MMTNKERFIELAWFIVLLNSGFEAQASEAQWCPPYISVSQELAAPLPGWDVRSYSNEAVLIRLSTVTFYAGPPNERVELTLSDGKTVENKSISKWKFNGKKSAGQNFWIECFYSNTKIALSKQLPDSVKECSVFYDRNIRSKSDFFVERLECK